MKRTGSFHPVALCLALLGLVLLPFLGCIATADLPPDTETAVINPDSEEEMDTDVVDEADIGIEPDRQAELTDLAQEWVETRDDSLIQQIQNEVELRFVEDLLQQWQGEEADPDSTETDPGTSYLTGCSGYWGSYTALSNTITFAENSWVDSSYSYHWSPNCSFPAPGNDCGTDHNDNMVSFWMGPDYTLTEAAYRVDTTSWATYWNLLYHGGASYRVYTSNAYGAWYGNAYVCLSNSLNASTLRFGRDY